MPSKQETFDTVVAHLRRQGKRCVANDRYGDCMYRGPGGMMCAAGVLIPDAAYHPRMERRSLMGYRAPDSAYAAVVAEGHDPLLVHDLQVVHDALSSWESVGLSECGEGRLHDVARRFGLEYTAP